MVYSWCFHGHPSIDLHSTYPRFPPVTRDRQAAFRLNGVFVEILPNYKGQQTAFYRLCTQVSGDLLAHARLVCAEGCRWQKLRDFALKQSREMSKKVPPALVAKFEAGTELTGADLVALKCLLPKKPGQFLPGECRGGSSRGGRCRRRGSCREGCCRGGPSDRGGEVTPS